MGVPDFPDYAIERVWEEVVRYVWELHLSSGEEEQKRRGELRTVSRAVANLARTLESNPLGEFHSGISSRDMKLHAEVIEWSANRRRFLLSAADAANRMVVHVMGRSTKRYADDEGLHDGPPIRLLENLLNQAGAPEKGRGRHTLFRLLKYRWEREPSKKAVANATQPGQQGGT